MDSTSSGLPKGHRISNVGLVEFKYEIGKLLLSAQSATVKLTPEYKENLLQFMTTASLLARQLSPNPKPSLGVAVSSSPLAIRKSSRAASAASSSSTPHEQLRREEAEHEART